MWTVFEPWQLTQLQRLASVDAERVESILNTVWQQYPGLMGDLAIAAVDQEHLSVDRCAELLDETPERVEERLIKFRQRHVRAEKAVIVDEGHVVAKLAEGGIAVWEIVRAYRRLGSVERLVEAFPALSTTELAAALTYAEKNPAEIEQQISKYEAAVQKRRAEYPFAR
jgi:uncharacterized protein (DUF433 family)